MESRKMRIMGILLGLAMALGLMPGLALAEGGELQAASSKPPQAIQATVMSVFTSDTGKNIDAKVVEGGGALSYAVKSGSEGYIAVNESTGELTIKSVPSDNVAYVTATAAETDAYAQTSVDVPVRVYDKYKYEVSFWTIQYSTGYRVYNLSSLDIKLFDKSGTKVGETTVENPKKGDKVEVLATNFADRVEMTAHIQLPKRDPFTLTGSGGIGGSINVWNPSSYSGKVFTCNYGMNAPEPDYAAPVAKTTLTANGTKQTLLYPGSVSVGGQMQYCPGTESGPNWNEWWTGCPRAVDPGTYYVWWRTHNYAGRSASYVGQGRSEVAPQCIEVTIGKGTISPTVDMEGWTYGEEAKTPTVTGNTGNGTVTYEYKVKGAGDDTYTTAKPTGAGEYTVRATIADTESYSGGSATKDFTIAKAAASTQDVRVMGVLSTSDADTAWVASIEQPLAGMMPSDAGALAYEAGEVKYADGTTTLPAGVTSFTSHVGSDGKVTAALKIPSTTTDIPEAVREITLPVTVRSQNYEDSTINVVVVPTKRTEKTVTIAGAPGSKTYGDDAFTLTATVDGEQGEASDWYWYSSDPNVLEVANTGSNEMPVTVKGPGSAMIMAWYEPSDPARQYIGAATTEPITVNKASISPSVSINGWTYGEAAKAPSVTGNTGKGAVTYSYSGTTSGETAFGPSADVPTQAGTYTVTATVAETDNYLGDTCTAEFTIAPKKVPVTVVAAEKTYDGTADANVVAAMKASDLVDGDLLEGTVVNDDGTVTFPGLKGTFDDPSAGQNKPITLDATHVTYPVADVWSYEAEITEAPAASILPRPVYAKADDKTSKHGQAIAELTYSLDSPDSSSGLVGEDTSASLGITASTAASSSSDVGEYPITLSGGTGNGNYNVFFAEGGTYTITKADGLTRSTNVMGVLSSSDADSAWVTSIEQPLAGMMPSDAGTLAYKGITTKYADGSTTLPEGVTSFTSHVGSDGKVTARLEIPSTATDIPEGVREITLSVTVTSENYEDSTINVVVVPTKRTEKTVTIAGAPDSKTYGDDAFTLTATADGEQGEASDWYWYSSDPNVLEIADTHSNVMSVTVKNPGSAMIMAWYEPSASSTIGAATTDPITVNKASISPSVSIDGWTYGEAANVPVLADGSNPGGCTVTYEYKKKGADDAYTEDAPFQAGEYTVRATVLESTYHKGGVCTTDFTIGKKRVDATVTAEDKTYDGTRDANVSAIVNGGVLEGDVVTMRISGAFADPNAGGGKEITLDASSVSLAGEGSANYEALVPSDPITASILPRPIVVKADDKSSRKGEAMVELTYGLNGSTTLAEGDTLASLGITASTTATSSSDVGEYPITLSGGTANPNYAVTLGEGAKYTITEPAPAPEPEKGTLYRLYNPYSGEHFFTASGYERDAVVAAGWTYEGEAWTAPESGIPVYRLYNPYAGEHHYTMSAFERDCLLSLGWNDEGTGWYSDEAESVAIYRLYNPYASSNSHHFTASAYERDCLVSLGWSDEGTGWYGLS